MRYSASHATSTPRFSQSSQQRSSTKIITETMLLIAERAALLRTTNHKSHQTPAQATVYRHPQRKGGETALPFVEEEEHRGTPATAAKSDPRTQPTEYGNEGAIPPGRETETEGLERLREGRRRDTGGRAAGLLVRWCGLGLGGLRCRPGRLGWAGGVRLDSSSLTGTLSV